MSVFFISAKQLKTVHTLLGKAGVTDKKDKQGVIREFSNGRTDSSKMLTPQEAEKLISVYMGEKPVDPRADRMRKKLIAMAHEMGWKKPDGKIDMPRVNNWCITYGYKHERLDAYTYEYLPKLLSQFEEVYRDYIKKVEPPKEDHG